MLEGNIEERTEAPTPRRRREARKRGNVVQSVELNSALILFTGTILIWSLGSKIGEKVGGVSSYLFRESGNITFTVENCRSYLIKIMYEISSPFIAFLGIIMLVGTASSIFQTKLSFSLYPLRLKLDKINPFNGIKSLFSIKKLFEVPKSILKFVLIGSVAYFTISREINSILHLVDLQVPMSCAFLVNFAFKLAIRLIFVFLLLAIIDYIFQKWQYEKSLRMTKHEVKEEHKMYEGDPTTKSRQRRIQLETARRRMLQEIPKADVVITNPTTLAIALKYDEKNMNAPMVVAKGARLMAEKIIEIAKKYGVPIVEDKILARMLYKLVEVGEEIPVTLYQAVAEVLSYVYRLKGRTIAS